MSRIRICRINKPGHPLHGLVVNYRDADENEGGGGGGGAVTTDKEAIKSLIESEMNAGYIGVGVHIVSAPEATNDGLNKLVARPQLGAYLDITDETFNKLKDSVRKLRMSYGKFESIFRFDYRPNLERETYDIPDDRTIGKFELFGSPGRRLHIDEFVWGQILNNAVRDEERTIVFSTDEATPHSDFSVVVATRFHSSQFNRSGDLALESQAVVDKFTDPSIELPVGQSSSGILSRNASWQDLLIPGALTFGYPSTDINYTIEFADGTSYSGTKNVEVRPTFSSYTATKLLRKDEDGWRYGFIKLHR